MARTKKNHLKPKKQLILLIAIGLILIASLLFFLFSDELFSQEASSDSALKSSHAFIFENGADQSFAPVGKYLAVASSTGLQILDEDGKTVSREVFSMDEPSVSAGGDTCVFYDVGGTSLRAFFGNEYLESDTDERIISAAVNSSGYLALTTEESGYKGKVSVFNQRGKEIYNWYSGSGYTLGSALTPDGSRLAVLCAEERGTVIHLFELDQEEEYASVLLPDELAFGISCNDDGGVYVLSNESLYFIGKDGSMDNSFSFDDNYLVDYIFSDNYCSVALSKYISGSETVIMSFSSLGKEMGRIDLTETLNSISSQKSDILIFTDSGIKLYSPEMRLLKEGPADSGYKSALLMADNTVLLIASHHGEKVPLK